MKLRHPFLFVISLAVAASQTSAQPQDQSASTNAAPISRENIGYAIGVSVGSNITNNLKRANFEVNTDEIINAIRDVLTGHEVKMTMEQAMQTINTYQRQRTLEVAEENRKAAEKFLTENKNKPGVKTKEITVADGKTAELQYKILQEGAGESPAATDSVKVKYRGTLLDGTEFDGTDRRGDQPAQFGVGQVIRGWSEALQMMKPGAKWQLFIPASLAYGDNPPPRSSITPGATLIFDVELIEIVKPGAESQPAAAQPRPLTSDIIRVPSAEEMKRGAQIETIKASDLEKSNAMYNATSGSKTNK
jgi:FKBP-type peptidyl-prolyl cis-trans isomerase FklB